METKKTIKSMSDVADLFLALYAKSFDREDDKVYFSKDMKSLIESALNESYFELSKLSCYENLIDEDEMIDIDEFMSKLRLSQTKKCWRDLYHFDIEQCVIYTEVETKNAIDIIEKYDEKDVAIINDFVQNYILFQDKKENSFEDVSISDLSRKYTKILKISND